MKIPLITFTTLQLNLNSSPPDPRLVGMKGAEYVEGGDSSNPPQSNLLHSPF